MELSTRHRYEDNIKILLENNPETRESDEILYYQYIKEVNHFDADQKTAINMLQSVKEGILPQMHTIIRIRQLVQAKHPELQSQKRKQREGKANRIREEILHS